MSATYTFDATTGARDLDEEAHTLGKKTLGYVLGGLVWAAAIGSWLCFGFWTAVLVCLISVIASLVICVKADFGWQADKVEALGAATGKALNKVSGWFKR